MAGVSIDAILKKLFPAPTRDQFAQRVLKSLAPHRQKFPAMRYDAKDFCIILGEGDEAARMFLGNAFNDYCFVPFRDRKRVLVAYAQLPSGMGREDENYETAKPHLLPKVRERFYHESLRLNSIASEIRPSTMPFSDDLTVEVVRDMPDSVSSLGTKVLERWNVSLDQALAVARENLWKISNRDFVEQAPGLFMSSYQDTHDASRLYLHDLIWQLKVKGEHVAMVPNRNVLMVTGSENATALCLMAALAEDVLRQPRPMSGIAVALRGTQWVPFLPPKDSPAYLPLRRARLLAEGQDYAEQRELLLKIAQTKNRDVYVATQMVMQREDKSMWTWTSWVQSVTDALMPRADYVTFGRPVASAVSENFGWAPFQRVLEIAGKLMQQTDDYPPRYHITEFPSEDMLAKLNLVSQEELLAKGIE